MNYLSTINVTNNNLLSRMFEFQGERWSWSPTWILPEMFRAQFSTPLYLGQVHFTHFIKIIKRRKWARGGTARRTSLDMAALSSSLLSGNASKIKPKKTYGNDRL